MVPKMLISIQSQLAGTEPMAMGERSQGPDAVRGAGPEGWMAGRDSVVVTGDSHVWPLA